MFSGTLVALATPFNDGQVDWQQLDELVDFQLAEGINGIVPMGTTGESPTLSHPEHERVIEAVVKRVGGKVPVVAGTGSTSTSEAVRLTKFARKVGADATLQVNPYYNKPTQQGLYEHFRTVAESTSLPCLLYNVPARTVASLAAETVVRLSQIDNIIGIKEASSNLDQISRIIADTNEAFVVYSGNDNDTLPIMAIGGCGVISVASHLVGNQIREMIDSFVGGKTGKAAEIHRHLLPLINALLLSPILFRLNMRLIM